MLTNKDKGLKNEKLNSARVKRGAGDALCDRQDSSKRRVLFERNSDKFLSPTLTRQKRGAKKVLGDRQDSSKRRVLSQSNLAKPLSTGFARQKRGADEAFPGSILEEIGSEPEQKEFRSELKKERRDVALSPENKDVTPSLEGEGVAQGLLPFTPPVEMIAHAGSKSVAQPTSGSEFHFSPKVSLLEALDLSSSVRTEALDSSRSAHMRTPLLPTGESSSDEESEELTKIFGELGLK